MDTINLHVGRKLKNEFKQKCLKNKTSMVEEVRKFMKWYIKEK